jgi:hypothetical protein
MIFSTGTGFSQMSICSSFINNVGRNICMNFMYYAISGAEIRKNFE